MLERTAFFNDLGIIEDLVLTTCTHRVISAPMMKPILLILFIGIQLPIHAQEVADPFSHYSGIVRFESRKISIGQFRFGNESTDSEPEVEFIWDRMSNKILKVSYLTNREISAMRFGQPLSETLDEWAIAVEIRSLFLLEEELNVWEQKYRQTRRNEGADYLRELADLTFKLSKVKAKPVVVVDFRSQTRQYMDVMRATLLTRIGSIVVNSRQEKRRWVANAFWNRVAEYSKVPDPKRAYEWFQELGFYDRTIIRPVKVSNDFFTGTCATALQSAFSSHP